MWSITIVDRPGPQNQIGSADLCASTYFVADVDLRRRIRPDQQNCQTGYHTALLREPTHTGLALRADLRSDGNPIDDLLPPNTRESWP
jgi:hypothetical protein